MASFDGHSFCARCREKGKGMEPCISDETSDCHLCNLFTPEQRAQISTPSYKLKKEKREAERLDSSTPANESSLVDPSTVSVIGVVGDAKPDKSPVLPPEKKLKKDKAPTKAKKDKASTSTSVDRISELDQKWSERFNRLEALLLSKSLQPTFSSEVRVNPSHSPPTNVGRDTEPFFQPTSRTLDDSSTPQRTGPDFSAAQQPSAGKLHTDSSASGSSSSQRTGPDSTAAKQKSAGKLSTDIPTSESSFVQRTGPDNTAAKQKSTGKLKPEHQRTKSSTGRAGPDTATARSKSTGKPHTDSHRPSSLPAQGSGASFTDPFSPTDLSLLSLPDPAHLLYRKLPEGTVLLAWSRKQTVTFQTGLR